jgi:hypothetical protein
MDSSNETEEIQEDAEIDSADSSQNDDMEEETQNISDDIVE